MRLLQSLWLGKEEPFNINKYKSYLYEKKDNDKITHKKETLEVEQFRLDALKDPVKQVMLLNQMVSCYLGSPLEYKQEKGKKETSTIDTQKFLKSINLMVKELDALPFESHSIGDNLKTLLQYTQQALSLPQEVTDKKVTETKSDLTNIMTQPNTAIESIH